MKKFVFFSLLIFFIVSGSVIGAAYLKPEKNISKLNNISGISSDESLASKISAAQVALHNKPDDCWQIIGNSVYDFSSYLSLHPPGSGPMIPYCGKDATLAYSTKDLDEPTEHSKAAKAMLPNYYIGGFLGSSTVIEKEKEETGDNQTVIEKSAAVLPINTKENAFSVASVANHNKKSDCWMIIDDSVYDVSGYFGKHPGGDSLVELYCGKDGSNAFSTKDKAEPSEHSVYARNLLENYFVGKLGGSTSNNSKTVKEVIPVKDKQISENAVFEPKKEKEVAPTWAEKKDANSAKVTLDILEVSKHKVQSDCWVIIDGKVYDITSYFGSHPGGTAVLAAACGSDATVAYKTKGKSGGEGHSAEADSLLVNYYIGDAGASLGLLPNGKSNTQGESAQKNAVQSALFEAYPGAIVIEGKTEDDGRFEGKILYNGLKYEVKIDMLGKIVRSEKDN